MNKKFIPILVVISLIIIVGAGAVITFIIQRYTPTKDRVDGKEYFGIVSDEEIPVIFDNEVLENKGKIIEGVTYFTTEMVSEYINQRFYLDKDTFDLIYTTPTEIVQISSNKDNSGYIRKGEQGYISLDLLKQYMTVNATMYESPSRFVIEPTEAKTYTVAMVTEDTVIRLKGGIKSPILTDVKKGQELEILEELLEWTKVATNDGYKGYLPSKVLGEKSEKAVKSQVVEEGYTSLTKDYKINLTWHQVTAPEGNASIDALLPTLKGVNTISPTWFRIKDNDGNLDSLADAEYVKKAHAAGLEVWALVDNFAKDSETYEVLSHTKTRRNVIDQLIKVTKENNIDGINVDLEAIGEEAAPHYVQFIRELSISCRREKIVLSVDNPVPMPYTAHYNRKEQGIMADYIIIMGYDEHTNTSESAGSVASLPFVKKGIEDTLKEVPAEKVINAIPFYTRLWTTQPDGSFTSKVFGMNGADEYVKQNGLESYWDEEASQYCAVLENEEGFYQIWLEEEKSIEEKMKLIPEYKLAGVASWKLGLQRNTIWDVILKYIQ